MKFTLFDLTVSFLCGVSLAAIIYDSMVDRSIALMTSQTKIMAQQRETVTKCIDAYAKTVDKSFIVRVIDDD